MKVFYTDKQVIESKLAFGKFESPSARKPKQIAEALKNFPNIEFIEPNPITAKDLYLCHEQKYVDDILSLQADNGFGNRSKEICDSLMYTNGAMVDAAKEALINKMPTCALVSGFHHAGYRQWQDLGYFCTFNGLLVAAFKILNEGLANNVAIIDCDQHWGNGTDDILNELYLNCYDEITHITFGEKFSRPYHAEAYLTWLQKDDYVEQKLITNKSDLIIYQAGADVHVDDPAGGVLTTNQIAERDRLMFAMAKRLNIPIAWNLAGGYQIEKDGSIDKVIEIHLNTFKAYQEVYL